MKCLVFFCLVSVFHWTAANNVLYMDSQVDCTFTGLKGVPRDVPLTVYGRTPGNDKLTVSACSIDFMASDSDAKLQLEFRTYSINTCSVTLYLQGDGSGRDTSYGCKDTASPDTYFAVGRTMTVRLYVNSATDLDYNFELKITAVRDDLYARPSDSHPMGVGLIIGICVGIFGIIIIVTICGVCCFRKYHARGSTRSPYLFDPEGKRRLEESTSSHVSVGLTNTSMKAGPLPEKDRGTPGSRKKLLAPSESSDEKSDASHKYARNKTNGQPSSEQTHAERNGGTGVSGNQGYGGDRGDWRERGVDVESRPSNPMLSALHQNAKFKNTFNETETDANERAKRIPSTSSVEKFGPAPNPPSSDESGRGRPSLPPVPKSPKSKKSKHAGIKRTPRPTSVSSDELAQIEKNRHENDDSDPNIRIMRDNDTPSSSELVAIKTKPPTDKTDTTHALRPDRKGGKGKKKQDTAGLQDDAAQKNLRTQRNRLQSEESVLNDSFEKTGSGRFNKRDQKSPRTKKKGGKGFSHRRNRSTDQFERPTTPNSMMGSMEDLESLPPLQRASSKNSLYASRTSLYDRRGRRRRGSYGESVASYSRDDMEIMRRSHTYDDDDEYYDDDEDFDGYEKPISRRERQRMFRSETDIGRGMRETSTQTLRETATQTGAEEPVTVQRKKLVKKRRRSKSMSSFGTQTGTKKNGEGKSKTKAEDQSDAAVPDAKEKKTKRSKSVAETDAVKKDKPKPKPKPRKESAATQSEEKKNKEKSASKENLAAGPGAQPPPVVGYPAQFYPGSGGFPYPPPPAYPGAQGVPMGYQPPNMYPQPVVNASNPPMPQSYSAAPRKPRKSNWEMLCELTEGEYPRDDVTETGSVASSVFATNLPPPGYMLQPGSQPAYYPNMHPGYMESTGQPAVPQRQYTPPDSARGLGPDAQADPQLQRVPVLGPGGQEQPLQKQSSWEALEELTGSRKDLPGTGAPNHRTESIV